MNNIKEMALEFIKPFSFIKTNLNRNQICNISLYLLRLSSLIMILICLFSNLYCEEKYYFYKPDIKIGSESVFNPLSMSINGGFDILRNGAHDKRLTEQAYQNGFKYTMKSVLNPFDTIEQIGWKEFMEQEFPNFKLSKEKLNFMPNLPIHTIGEGMRFAKVSEWYDYHGYPYPKTLGLLTSISYQLLNETMEQGEPKRRRTDPVADVCFYNNLGFVLFSINPVKRFFSETFVINDWSLQPMYNPLNDNIENAGEQYCGKYKLTKDYAVFCYWGMDFLAGVSKKVNEDHALSLGVGQVVNKIDTKYINGEYVAVVSTIDLAVGVFYDYENSLLASTHFSMNKDTFKAKLNVYPGFLSFASIKPGMYSKFSYKDGEVTEVLIGMSIDKLPVGLIFGDSVLDK